MKPTIDKDQTFNQDFFQKVMGNPKLVQAFSNPQYMMALNEFGKDPKAAMAKYGSNPEFRDFMQDLCGVMGTHFETMAEKEEEKKKQVAPIDPVT